MAVKRRCSRASSPRWLHRQRSEPIWWQSKDGSRAGGEHATGADTFRRRQAARSEEQMLHEHKTRRRKLCGKRSLLVDHEPEQSISMWTNILRENQECEPRRDVLSSFGRISRNKTHPELGRKKRHQRWASCIETDSTRTDFKGLVCAPLAIGVSDQKVDVPTHGAAPPVRPRHLARHLHTRQGARARLIDGLSCK